MASYQASAGVYGAPRVFKDLREAGETCSLNRVDRLMKEHKIKALRGYKTPKRVVGRPTIVTPNKLKRAFTVEQPNTAWVTDITYSVHLAGVVVSGRGRRPVLATGC